MYMDWMDGMALKRNGSRLRSLLFTEGVLRIMGIFRFDILQDLVYTVRIQALTVLLASLASSFFWVGERRAAWMHLILGILRGDTRIAAESIAAWCNYLKDKVEGKAWTNITILKSYFHDVHAVKGWMLAFGCFLAHVTFPDPGAPRVQGTDWTFDNQSLTRSCLCQT